MESECCSILNYLKGFVSNKATCVYLYRNFEVGIIMKLKGYLFWNSVAVKSYMHAIYFY